jgi:protein-L-isoaspartate O-methyltransferase
MRKRAHRGASDPQTAGLAPRQAAGVYDRIGRLQDTQVIFEGTALARLTADGRLSEAHHVVEIGCGTG